MRAYAFLFTSLWVLGPQGNIDDACGSSSRPCTPAARLAPVGATANDNRRPAGSSHGDTLALALVAQPALWYPEGDEGLPLQVFAFAEEGKAPSVPGPLVRVREGTVVRARVRNATAHILWLRGLHERPAPAATAAVPLAPGETRELVFKLMSPGTYSYQAALAPFPAGGATVRPLREDGQLVGALVVDARDTRAAHDRILVLTRWAISDTSARGPLPVVRFALTAINGRSWPHTERLEYAEGDSVRWRVINASPVTHPMHLHGFYFRVGAKGSATGDTTLATPRLVVTEVMTPGQTMDMRWLAERGGNWLFHCHLLAHMSPRQRVARVHRGDTLRSELERIMAGEPRLAAAQAPHHGDHATQGMAGLVLGVHVRARAAVASRGEDAQPRRTLRLFANARDVQAPLSARYGFVLQHGRVAPAPDSVRRPGAPIVLRRGEPVEILVFNRLPVPLSVHWHGLELESFFDGVGGFSGTAGHIAPPIAPGDSFAVRMTPPRAGTFMYHVHGEDGYELPLGLHAPLLVLDDPAARDPAVDHVLLVADSSPRLLDGTVVNGSTRPTLTLVAGRANRLRVIGITSNATTELVILRGADTVVWRMVARDGAELASPAAPTRARWLAGPGTIADFALTPTAPGELTLQVTNGAFNPDRTATTRIVRRWTSPIIVVAAPVALGARR